MATVEFTIARNTSTQKAPYRLRATPSHESAPEVPKVANLSGPKATSTAYVVKMYRIPMSSVASSTARRTVRRGSRASSASGAAPSKPPKARIVYTDPAITPAMPACSGGVWPVPKTDSVFAEPAWMISRTARITNTAISKMPSTVPSPAEVRMP